MAAVLVSGCASTHAQESPGPTPLSPDAQRLHDQAIQIYAAAQEQDTALRRLEYLSDHIGHRLSGSESLERAVDWSATEMEKDGLIVDLHPVQVPHWERGSESASLLSPVKRELSILGLGMTVGGTVEGEVVVLTSFEALETTDVTGKIVLFDVPFTTYGETVQYRVKGPSRVATRRALCALGPVPADPRVTLS